MVQLLAMQDGAVLRMGTDHQLRSIDMQRVRSPDATALCGKILMVSEEEMNNSRYDTSVPATNPSPIVLVQIG
jgi:2-methylcitrate dehydratase PrpD